VRVGARESVRRGGAGSNLEAIVEGGMVAGGVGGVVGVGGRLAGVAMLLLWCQHACVVGQMSTRRHRQGTEVARAPMQHRIVHAPQLCLCVLMAEALVRRKGCCQGRMRVRAP